MGGAYVLLYTAGIAGIAGSREQGPEREGQAGLVGIVRGLVMGTFD